jgi:hypothetical protein
MTAQFADGLFGRFGCHVSFLSRSGRFVAAGDRLETGPKAST